MSKFNIPFKRYKKNMLPDGYQDEDVEEFIENNAKRVVRITYKTSYGSGIVFKLGDQLCILTNYHVIRKANPNYRKIGINIGGQVWKIESYWGGCKRHDMALLELSRGPDPLRSLPIPGINQLVVEITVDGECFKGLVEYHRGEGRYVVHALKFSERRLDDDIEVVCKFMKVKKPAICRMRDVCYCSETGCAIIFIDSQILPKKVKSMFESQKIWETVQNPLVVVLSHPLGDVKHISTGNVMQEESDKNGFPQFKPAKNVCFKIEGDHDKCQFGNSVGISKSPSQQRSCPVDQQSASNPRIYSPTTERKSNKHADEFVRKDIGPHSGTQYFFVNNNGERVKFPTIEDVTSYFSCSGHDTKNSPVNRDDNRKYFYATEGRVYCSTTNAPCTFQVSSLKRIYGISVSGLWHEVTVYCRIHNILCQRLGDIIYCVDAPSVLAY